MFVPHCSGVSLFRHSYLAVGASKGTPGDAKCVAEILEGDKNKEVRGGTKFTGLFQGKISELK